MKLLSEYAKSLEKKLSSLESKDYLPRELATALELQEYQVSELIEQKKIDLDEKDDELVVSADEIAALRENPEEVVSSLCMTSLELSSVLQMPRDSIGPLLSKGIVKTQGKRKRRGHLRSFFYLRDCLSAEDEIDKECSHIRGKIKRKKQRVRRQHRDQEEDLKSKAISTAERPVVEDLSMNAAVSEVHGAAESRFELDEWQTGAIDAIESGKHVFVQAPTGAGKTAVVEEYLKRNLSMGLKMFYAVPIKALANDKYFDFCELYGRDKVGINTGDVTIDPDAQIVVGTTEILRNILFDRSEAYNVVAFDEAQYLGDEERGSAWEESIILASPDTLLVFLSGSVANADEVLAWIRNIKTREVALFEEKVRPVPLRFAFPYDKGFIEKKEWHQLRELGLKTHREFYHNSSEFFAAALRSDMTPMLAFLPRRRDCEEIFDGMPNTNQDHRDRLTALIEEHPDGRSLSWRLRKLIVEKGVAFHHSGLIPSEKRVVENLAKRGELHFIAATMSLASGVNFSVRSCLIPEYCRPGKGGRIQALAPSEILQMWGRAGRRRLDSEGYVIPCMNINEISAFERIEAFPEDIQRDDFVSAINILSILRRYDVEMLEELYQKSFSSFVYKKPYRLFADHVMFREAKSICSVPTYELPPYRQGVYQNLKPRVLEKKFRCASCSNLEECTRVYEKIKPNRLQKMIKHLKKNEFIREDFTLTYKGQVAEKFHSEVGLLVASDIVQGRVRPDNVIKYCASVNAAAHIDFGGPRAFLSSANQIYPSYLFPTMWERFRGRKAFIYWNPTAGSVAKKWVESDQWEGFCENLDLAKKQGDVFRMLLRAGELLRSMSFLGDLKPEIAEAAKVGTKLVMRPPLVPDSLFNEVTDH